MNVWLVIPAWRRYAVTRLCLAQKQRLVADLAARGVTANVVVVADDENLEIAASFGFDTVTQSNDTLGRKVNDGFQHAYERGCDYAAFVGSDDWIHADALGPLSTLLERPGTLLERPVPLIAGHQIAVVDLEHQRLRRLGVRGPHGVSPWFIPRWLLDRTNGRPAEDEKKNGLEGSITQRSRLYEVEWLMHDPHDLCRVDFKSSENMTPYDRVAGLLGYGDEIAPWTALAERYPLDLVTLAYETSRELAGEALAA